MRKFLVLMAFLLNGLMQLYAQDIKVTKFERNFTSLIASMDPVYDNAGEACAVIRFLVRDEGFEIEPNLGVLKRENRIGEVRLWVPVGTKRIIVRHLGAMPLSYEISFTLEPKVTYDAVLEIKKAKTSAIGTDVKFFVGAGYNVLSISGPSLAAGVDVNHHIVELGFVYGLNKTDDWYFYNSNGDVLASYNYKALRLSLRYGYDFKASDAFSIVPQVGFAYNGMSGTSESKTSNSTYQSASSISAFGAVRLALALGKNFKLQVTPEYDFGLSKSDVCKLVSDNDDTFKSWTDGFNLNVGLMIYF